MIETIMVGVFCALIGWAVGYESGYLRGYTAAIPAEEGK